MSPSLSWEFCNVSWQTCPSVPHHKWIIISNTTPCHYPGTSMWVLESHTQPVHSAWLCSHSAILYHAFIHTSQVALVIDCSGLGDQKEELDSVIVQSQKTKGKGSGDPLSTRSSWGESSPVFPGIWLLLSSKASKAITTLHSLLSLPSCFGLFVSSLCYLIYHLHC